jgi:two-component sensor histidine kinase
LVARGRYAATALVGLRAARDIGLGEGDKNLATTWGALARRGLRPGSAAAFGFAFICIVVATALRLAIDLVAPGAVPFATYFPAILIATLVAGTAAGIIVMAFGALISWYVFVPPRFAVSILNTEDMVSLGLYFLAALAIVWIADRYRAVLRRLDEEEAYRKVVVEELGHRVKNKLATVYAILRHELRGHRDVWESAAGRLRALSAADDFLVAGDGEGVRLEQIIDLELAPYGSASVKKRGAPLALSGKLPSVLSLIVHELATNAAKYGALSAPDGVIDIDWAEDGDDLVIVWRERGGPPVVAPDKRSFGTNLIERSLGAFNGSATVDFAPGGVICRMRVPKAACIAAVRAS